MAFKHENHNKKCFLFDNDNNIKEPRIYSRSEISAIYESFTHMYVNFLHI